MKKNVFFIVGLSFVVLLALSTTSYSQGCGKAKSLACGNCDDSTELINAKSKPSNLSEGNVWQTEDGKKYYTCPVMGNSGAVENAEAYSIVDKVKYYHCCPACQAPFRADPGKYLKHMILPGNVISLDEKGEKRFRDPVNGAEGIVNGKTQYFDLEGKRYYFLDKKHMKKFRKNPAVFLS